jgi:hypothetical protein
MLMPKRAFSVVCVVADVTQDVLQSHLAVAKLPVVQVDVSPNLHVAASQLDAWADVEQHLAVVAKLLPAIADVAVPLRNVVC